MTDVKETNDNIIPNPTEEKGTVGVPTSPVQLEWEFHPFANFFPLMDDEGIEMLCADIDKDGQYDLVFLYEGKILSGRAVAKACAMLGRIPDTAEFTGDDPLGFILSKNALRQHFKESQRAMVAARLANMCQGERTDLQLCANLHKVSQSEAADKLRVSRRSVIKANRIITDGTPELVSVIDAGKLSVSTGIQLVRVASQELQNEIAAIAKMGDKKALAAALRKTLNPVSTSQTLESRAAGFCSGLGKVMARDYPSNNEHIYVLDKLIKWARKTKVELSPPQE